MDRKLSEQVLTQRRKVNGDLPVHAYAMATFREFVADQLTRLAPYLREILAESGTAATPQPDFSKTMPVLLRKADQRMGVRSLKSMKRAAATRFAMRRHKARG